MRMRRGGQGIGFTDLLFNALLGIFVLFALTLLLVNPVAEQGKIDHKAEIIITLTWPDDLDIDLDIWVSGPECGVLSFRKEETCIMTLDRDDLGQLNDQMASGFISSNQEIVAVRGHSPGRYSIAVHTYRANSPLGEFKVTVQDLNPRVVTVFERSMQMGDHKRETYVISLDVLPNGVVVPVNRPTSVVSKFMGGG